MTQPKPSPSQVVPVLIAALVCDVAVRDPGSGKQSLIGVFDKLTVGRFPTVRPMSVYIKFTDAEGHYDLEIKFLQADTGQILAGAKGSFDVTDRLSSIDLNISFPPLPFPSQGRYEFQVWTNSVFLGSTFLDAIHRSHGGEK